MQRLLVYIIGVLVALWLIAKVVRYLRRPQPPRCNSCNDQNCPLRRKEYIAENGANYLELADLS